MLTLRPRCPAPIAAGRHGVVAAPTAPAESCRCPVGLEETAAEPPTVERVSIFKLVKHLFQLLLVSVSSFVRERRAAQPPTLNLDPAR